MSRNPIWDYFTKSETDSSKAKCTDCTKLLSLGSDKPGKQTTHGLKCHLEKCHPELFADYTTKLNKRSEGPPASKKRKLEEQSNEPKLVQLSLPVLEERSNKWPDDHPAVKRIEKSIMDLIIVDMLPYSIVDGDAFKRFNFADPAGARRYEPKSEKYFRTTLMPATYDKVASRVRSLLSDVQWVSFTTDGWTKLQAAAEDVGLLQMKAALRDAVNKRFSSVKSEPNLTAATLLDPRFKDMYFSSHEKDTAKGVILTFLRRQREKAVREKPSCDDTDRDVHQPTPSTSAASTEAGLWDDYDNYVPDNSPLSNPEVDTYENELDSYLRQPRVPRSANIYGYWNCSQFPGLELAAKKYLSAPPTSVASEQLFSAAGQIYSDRRSNLLGENAEKLLFLSYNIRLFNFNY